jgi:hypothetical protein
MLIIATLISLWAERAIADTGNELPEACEHFTAKLPTLPVDIQQSGVCIGYIRAIRDAMQPSGLFCGE